MTDRTLTRIGALLRKAESTDNDHEAAAYLAAAQRLATIAAIDLTVARAATEHRERRATPTQREVEIGAAGKRGLRTYVELFVAIARANDVTVDVARNSTRVFGYGFDSDLDTVQALYASLIVQMVRASDEYIKSGRYRQEVVRRFSPSRRRVESRPVSPVTARISFQRAYAARIGRRLAEARAAATKQMTSDQGRADRARRKTVPANGESAGASVALALRAKELELREHYRAHSTARGSWRGSAASAGFAAGAARAGDRSARRARLGSERSIGGARPALPPAGEV